MFTQQQHFGLEKKEKPVGDTKLYHVTVTQLSTGRPETELISMFVLSDLMHINREMHLYYIISYQ